MKNTWSALIPPGGTLIPANTDPKTRQWLMSDGNQYTSRQLFEDRRNREGLTLSTVQNRLGAGVRDIEEIFRRRPNTGGPGKRSMKAANTTFNRQGLPL